MHELKGIKTMRIKESKLGILTRKLFYFLTLPLRRWWGWLIILILLFLAPTVNGVKPSEVHLWYLNKLDLATTEKTPPSSVQITKPAVTIPNTADNMVDLQMRSSKTARRRGFQVAEEPVHAVNVLADEEFVKLKPLPEVTIQEIEQKKSSIDISKLKKSSSLRYLKEVKNIKGIAVIHNANEIEINDNYIFLFGIYIDPNSSTGQKAKDFLSNITQSSEVDCHVVALTYQNVPTAICFTDDQNLNQLLVKEGLTRDVMLNKR